MAERPRPPLVLTGPPAAGKTACGRRLAEARPRAAFVDVDDVRQLVVAGAVAPWAGEEGRRQQRLGALNAIALTRGFVEAGFEVVVADVLTPESVELWRAAGLDALIVRLRLPERAARRRAESRPRWITDDEFALLHAADRDRAPAADALLGVDGLTVEQQTARLEAIWADATRDREDPRAG